MNNKYVNCRVWIDDIDVIQAGMVSIKQPTKHFQTNFTIQYNICLDIINIIPNKTRSNIFFFQV